MPPFREWATARRSGSRASAPTGLEQEGVDDPGLRLVGGKAPRADRRDDARIDCAVARAESYEVAMIRSRELWDDGLWDELWA